MAKYSLKGTRNFYQIPERSYSLLRKKILNSEEKLTEQERQEIADTLEDVRYLLNIRKSIIDEQNREFDEVFNNSGIPAPTLEDYIDFNDDINNDDDSDDSNSDGDGNGDDGNGDDDGSSSGKGQDPSGEPGEKPPKRTGQKTQRKATVHNTYSFEENPICSNCNSKMHKTTSKKRTVIFATPIMSVETSEIEVCRCLNCDTKATAPYPEKLDDTFGKYHYSMVAVLASLRYLYGMPSKRFEELSENQGYKISDATSWDLFELAANKVKPFYNNMMHYAKENMKTVSIDDTSNLIIMLQRDIAAQIKNASPEDTIRTGIHTTCSVVDTDEGALTFFNSGLHHAGEILAKTIEKTTNEEKIVVMADALSANFSKIEKDAVDIAKCNSHSFRRFKENSDLFIELIPLIEKYATVFKNEKHCKNSDITGEARLQYHRNNSLPVMESIKKYIEGEFENKNVEPNSKLGKDVFKYFLNHYEELIAFCRIKNAPLENNTCERMIKCIVKHRKNSLFFRTQVGANVGDILGSILITAKQHGLNAPYYLEMLLTHSEKWRKDFKSFLPWNFTETINKIDRSPPLNEK